MSCTVTETLNGEWELTLVHDIDERGKWTRLSEGCMGYQKIAEAITAAGGKRMRGSTAFSASSIQSIVDNEIYVGDRMLQKRPPQAVHLENGAVSVQKWMQRVSA